MGQEQAKPSGGIRHSLHGRWPFLEEHHGLSSPATLGCERRYLVAVDVMRRQGTQFAVLCLILFGPALTGQSAAHAQDAADTQLEVDIQRGPGLPVERYLLGCNPPSGTVGDPAAACNRIADQVARPTKSPMGGLFPTDPGGQGIVVCPQIYGGPEIAIVRGRFVGTPVNARLTRENGCTMSRYDATMKLLGIP